MNRSCTLALFTVVSLALAAPTSASTLSVELRLASIPASITLCRDAANMAVLPIDHQWQIVFDLDGNASTGDPEIGLEAVLVVGTLVQFPPCAPHAVAAGSAFESYVTRWNTIIGDWDVVAPATVTVDAPNATLHVSFDDSALSAAGVGGIARIGAAALAGYTLGGTVTFATDGVPFFTRGNSPTIAVTDPAADVIDCATPCSTASAWYPLIDIRALQVGGVTDHLLVAGFE